MEEDSALAAAVREENQEYAAHLQEFQNISGRVLESLSNGYMKRGEFNGASQTE